MQTPSGCTFQETIIPVQGVYGRSKDCLILILFRLPQISCYTLSLSPLTQTIALMWGLDPCFSSPTCWGQSSPTNTAVFPPSSFILARFVWVYIFFSSGQVLLSALSWCFACTSVSEGVILMYPWREMYSTSTHSSVILFSEIFLIMKWRSFL